MSTVVPQTPSNDEALALLESVAGGDPAAVHAAVTALLHEVFAPQIENALTARATQAADAVAGGVQGEIARLRAELAKLGA